MKPSTFINVPVSLTATEINALDTTEATAWTFPTTGNVVRIPRSLNLVRASGTLYTVGDISKSRLGQDLAVTRSHGEEEDVLSQPWLLFYLKGTRGVDYRERLVFRVPIKELLNEKTNHYDTTQSETRLIVEPFSNGLWWQPNQFSSLVVVSNVSLSGGTGSVTGEFWFEEVAV